MIEDAIRGVPIRLKATQGLFSPGGIDRGTRAMLSLCALSPGQRVLDLGCGAGVVGIYAAKLVGEENVFMCDINPLAVESARENALINGVRVRAAVSDALSGVTETGFDWILVNPPYQTDFCVAKRMIEKGFNRLKLGGQMALVVKRRTWYENKLRAVFGGARVCEEDGYFVMFSTKRRMEYANLH